MRCRWALLSPRYPNPGVPGSQLELVFTHPDPVLAVHLAKQNVMLLGRGIIEFIHPAERERESRSAWASADTKRRGGIWQTLSRRMTFKGASRGEFRCCS